MKKLYMLIIAVLFMFPIIVNADATYTCEAGDYSCVFNVTINDIECKNKTDGKKLELQEPMTNNMITYNFDHFEINGVNQGRQLWNQVYLDKGVCPDYLYTMNKRNGKVVNGMMYFKADYYLKLDSDHPEQLTKYGAGDLAELLTKEFNIDHKTFIGTFTKVSETGATTCADEISIAYGKFQDFQVSYDGKCAEDGSSEDCQKLLEQWKAYIPEAEAIQAKWINDPNCSESDKQKIASVIASADYGIKRVTTTTRATTSADGGKTYDFSNNGCPLGEEVTKDLSGALKVMKILAPVFVFVYTVYDTIVALTKGDAQAEGKKMLQKFIKRLVAALVLFAIPVLIDVLMQLFNIWDNTGHCSFTGNGESQVTAPVTGGGGTSMTVNANASQQCLNACENAGNDAAKASCRARCTTSTN